MTDSDKIMFWRGRIPQEHIGLYDAAMLGFDQAAAIKSHCLSCMSWNAEAVQGCEYISCPLFVFRAGHKKTHVPLDRSAYAGSLARWRGLIPAAFKASWDLAVRGKSCRLAIQAYCAECRIWHEGNVNACEVVNCALHRYRNRAARHVAKEGRTP